MAKKYKGKIHFGVYTIPVQERSLKIAAYVYQIVIKRPDGIVAHHGFTGLERYAYPYNGGYDVHGISIMPSKYKLQMICNCLNYLVLREGIHRLQDITIDMIYRCLDAYRTTAKGSDSEEYVTQATLDKYVSVICSFFCNLSAFNSGMQFQPRDLMKQTTYYSKRNLHGSGRTIYVPLYSKKAIQSYHQPLLREMPEAAIPILFEEIRKHDPMIYLAAVFQAYAGLRAAECMNLRREDSPLSSNPGVKLIRIGDRVQEMYLDLTREFHLRSDGVDVGKIKRITDSMTMVYPKNLPIVLAAYQDHLKIISSFPCEKEYAPLFVGAAGKAMTTETYQRRFNVVVKQHLRPRLLESADPQLVAFGQALLTNNFPTHGLRHYFSVHLALDGLDAAQIMAYRGDRNVDSSVVYLQNKGILAEQLRKSHTIALAGLTKQGGYFS